VTIYERFWTAVLFLFVFHFSVPSVFSTGSTLPPVALQDRFPSCCVLCPPISPSQARPAWFKGPGAAGGEALACSPRWLTGMSPWTWMKHWGACVTWSETEERGNTELHQGEERWHSKRCIQPDFTTFILHLSCRADYWHVSYASRGCIARKLKRW